MHLVARLNAGGFQLLDAQFMNPHLKTLGAIVMSKADYKELLPSAIVAPADFNRFKDDNDPARVLELASPL